MFAIIEVGAKQYQVKKGDIITVEKQPVNDGKEVSLKNVLLVSKDKKVEVGKPFIKGAEVKAVVIKQAKDKRKISFKYRRRKASKKTVGHRQKKTQLKIKEIEFAG